MPNAVRVHASPPLPSTKRNRSTIRFLESGTSTLSTKLLGLATTGVGDQQRAVELDEGGLEHVLGVLIDELGVVSDLKGISLSVSWTMETREGKGSVTDDRLGYLFKVTKVSIWLKETREKGFSGGSSIPLGA
jgi:hypothetical protein